MNVRRAIVSVMAASALVVLPIGHVPDASPSATVGPSLRAVRAADAFLDAYLTADGRVIRRDQGSDTVSEGQAYAMVLAVAIGDEARFRLAWTWTTSHLQRPDGLLAWRWQQGRVVDPGAASDADLLTAWALGLAGARFTDAGLTRDAKRMAHSVVMLETIDVHPGRILVAGPWATTASQPPVNPSYFVTPAMSQLWWITADAAWAGIATSARRALTTGTANAPHLPADWTTVDGSAAAAPNGTGERFSYDAARVIVQQAVDCDPAGRAIAVRSWPFFAALAEDRIGAVYALDGTRVGTDRHPITLVAAAAAAHAAGDESAARLLDEASALDATHPTYYGSAWIALGRIWLDTPLLGGCGRAMPHRAADQSGVDRSGVDGQAVTGTEDSTQPSSVGLVSKLVISA